MELWQLCPMKQYGAHEPDPFAMRCSLCGMTAREMHIQKRETDKWLKEISEKPLSASK